VTQHLRFPRDQPIQASKDFANSIHEANSDGVKAYAKIAAYDWTYYVTKLVVNIGRGSDVVGGAAPAKDDEVQIDLGPSKTISRQHAVIYFNTETEQWMFKVKGRNGAKVDVDPMKAGTVRTLQSGEVLEIGGIEMMFVLPAEIADLAIHETFLERAGVPAASVRRPETSLRGGDAAAAVTTPKQEDDSRLNRTTATTGRQQAIAPAPPDYRRPGTPPSTARRRTAFQASPYPMSEMNSFGSSLEIDLSKDENKNIKPQYSYAQLISQAIMQAEEERLNLSGIYNFIIDHYAYYRHMDPGGWQVGVVFILSASRLEANKAEFHTAQPVFEQIL
jgi:forkhead protein FKH